ncbi:MAG TPA: copper chaperone PCu(A)C, partial [Pilimelia sp.]|nr:copper chaperone PCu(A)C [Pilimelia sp.]
GMVKLAGQGPASFTIPAHGFVTLRPGAAAHLALEGLRERLAPGSGVALVFEFSNGVQLRLTAPVGVPLTPTPRATPSIPAGEGEGGH